jgi:HopA1 effector protein family
MNFSEQVESLLNAVTVHSSSAYTWMGNLSPQLYYSKTRGIFAPQVTRGYLLYNLQCRLYRDFYCCGFPRHSEQAVKETENWGITPFSKQLSAANAGSGYCSEGWEISSVNRSQVIVCRAGLKLWVHPRDCVISRGVSLQPGMLVAVRFPKEFLNISPGFYMAMGNKELLRHPGQIVARLYFNITADGAISFMRKVTSVLDDTEIAFTLKIISDPTQFNRCDSAVLYIYKTDYGIVSELIAGIYPGISRYLKNGEPAFTKRLARGLCLAEDPGENESFGSHRCRVLAEALVRGFERRKESLQERIKIVRQCFEEHDIDFYKPFLTPPYVDDYDFPRHSQDIASQKSVPGPEPSSAAFLRMATIIGQSFVGDAIWKGTCCNWMGIGDIGPLSRTARNEREYRALGSDLYSGTSGVALFLSQLFLATRDMDAHRCAVGAINQAMSRLQDMQSEARWICGTVLNLKAGFPSAASC